MALPVERGISVVVQRHVGEDEKAMYALKYTMTMVKAMGMELWRKAWRMRIIFVC